MKNVLIAFVLTLVGQTVIAASTGPSKKCLFVNSYHSGYHWSDGIERAVLSRLQGHCTVETFYLDTKRNPSPEYAVKKGLEAKAWIEARNPDVVILSDDPAVENILVPYFKNATLPFVFCGVNLDARHFGLPFENATGMIEVAPFNGLLSQVKSILPTAKTGVFLTSKLASDQQHFEFFRQAAQKYGIVVKSAFAKDMKDWERKFKSAQSSDFLIFANYAGIQNWTFDRARKVILKHSRKLNVSYQEFMVNLVAFSLTKIPQEQGDWAAQVALEMLAGTKPSQIPVAVNRRWNLYINDEVAHLSQTNFSPALNWKANKASLSGL